MINDDPVVVAVAERADAGSEGVICQAAACVARYLDGETRGAAADSGTVGDTDGGSAVQ